MGEATEKSCARCQGVGILPKYQGGLTFTMQTRPCPKCKGSGVEPNSAQTPGARKESNA